MTGKHSYVVEPWESSDGALHLLNDLSEVCPKEIAKHISQLAELTSVTGFHHADCLKETIYMYLPTIMKNVGKAICKENLEFFYDDLFRAIKGQNHKLSAVASDCLRDIGKLIGTTILKGRLNEYRPEYADQYDIVLQTSLK